MKNIFLIIFLVLCIFLMGFTHSSGIVIPDEKRIDFHDSNHALKAYIYYDADTTNLFFNSGNDLFTVGGINFYQALYVNPAVDPAMDKSVLFIVTNNGGNVAIRNVEVGAANSGGTGYRMLRVTN